MVHWFDFLTCQTLLETFMGCRSFVGLLFTVKMAEAGNAPQHQFYCHYCKCETNPKLPDLVCPACKSGFIEEVPANSSLLRDSTASVESDNSSSLLSDLFQLLFIENSARLSSPSSTESDWTDAEEEYAGQNDTFSPSAVATEREEQEESSSVSEGETASSPEENNSMDGIMHQFLSDSFANNGSPGAGPTSLSSMLQMYSNPEDYAWGLGGLDTVVTELLGQLENTGPAPATQEEISSLPTVCISQEQIDCRLGCPVCREEYSSGESVRKLPCLHFFHDECIVPWLKLHNSCPVCRKSLDGVDNSLPPTSEPPE
ncbi:E3 ubiquitin-protein ligase RNF115 isoform X1 [Nothobranchius furzeri]|uniref:RING-type E3 ubiquitin transferase n=3 Tax=Nothobranchius furzeri TaxID=105023 RepID=A0A8C6VUC4_NOTFU|nr:transcript variant X1 [Nothobranchius furzeri]